MPKDATPRGENRRSTATRDRRVKRAKDREKTLKKTFTTGKVAKLIQSAVAYAELALPGKGRGTEKHAMVKRLLNGLVDIPILNEATEGYLIGVGIDAALKALEKVAKPKTAPKTPKTEKV